MNQMRQNPENAASQARKRFNKVAADLGVSPKQLMNLVEGSGITRPLRDNSMLTPGEVELLRVALEESRANGADSGSTELATLPPRFKNREDEWRHRAQRAPQPREVDRQIIATLATAVAALQQAGPGWAPDEVAQRGRGIVYRDLLDERQEIFLPFERYQELIQLTPEQRAEDKKRQFHRFSRPTLERLEKALGQLWCAVPNCILCGQPLPPRDRGKLWALIDGRAALPDPGAKPHKRRRRDSGPKPLTWVLMHDECREVAQAAERVWADLHKLRDEPERHEQERRAGYRRVIDEHYPVFVEKQRVTPAAAIALVASVIKEVVRE